MSAVHTLLWDVDGTLLRTGRAGLFALVEAADAIAGTRPELEHLSTAGFTDAMVAQAVLRECGVDEADEATVLRFLRIYEEHLPDRLHLRAGAVLPGVEAILADLHARPDVQSLLLTGNTPAGARAKLRHYGLERFFAAGGAFSVDMSPRADIARRAVQAAAALAGEGFALERTFVIGDTPHDVAAGHAIGARVVVVAGSHERAELEACEPWLVLDGFPPPAEFRALLGIGERPAA
ncbi:MAG TPA: haloacid dehalogenase-like hydrolase [Solirubrobacteraceae bacterium]|nr:haloacid dehalogenase-like hydrolase [Solirubrobacteraceae bacterium]